MFKLWIIYYWLGLMFREKWKSREAFLRWQAKRMARFQRRTLRKSPFYRKLLAEGKTLADFPLMNKTDFMGQFNQINTVGLDRDEAMGFAIEAEQSRSFNTELDGLTIGLSTGTSGNRGLFVASPRERARWAANIFSRVVKPRLFHKQKVAFILRANSNLYESVKSILFSFRFIHLSTPLAQIIRELNEYQPGIISGQPSLLRELAFARKEGILKVTPTQIISYAEVLEDQDRKLIEQTFSLQITEVYQCTEGFLAHSCSHGRLRLNEDLVHFEQKQIDGKRFQPIVTDFTRTSQPVVRYLMNDVLQLPETPCACGSVFLCLEKIEGRTDEVLDFVGENDQSISVYPDFIRRAIVMSSDQIRDYRVEQLSVDKLHVFLQTESDQFEKAKAAVAAALQKLFASYQIADVRLTFFDQLPPLPEGGKMRRIRKVETVLFKPSI
ncbi:MAG: F390 synthetase-related protein [Bacteroidota bacterium]